MRVRLPFVAALGALGLTLAALAVWRGACVTAGPDIDTDAYAHHMIARAILADPRDLAVHWVWLPLFHYAQVPLVALGGTMQVVRWANVALTAALPFLLFAYVSRSARAGASWMAPEAVGLLAGLFSAACPIAMQMGTTAQPEPLFALLVLGFAIAFERGSNVLGAALLGAAVMLRYEAWAALAAAGAMLALDALRGRRRQRAGWRAWIVVVVPVSLILAWAALRRPVDGRWFGFLGQTQEFATDALHVAQQQHGRSVTERAIALARDLLYYPVFVPIRVLGAAMILVPFGIVRTVRQQGARFVIVLAACLGFVSLSWVRRAMLGLDRHFVCVVPLYATFAAQGAAAIGDGVARFLRRVAHVARGRTAALGGRAVAGALACLSLGVLAVQLTEWMGFWRASIQQGWPERAAIGTYLRSLPGTAVVFCDEATIEIPSGLDRRRFDRHWVDDPHTWDLIGSAARERGVAYVATWRRKLHGHERSSPTEPGAARGVTGDIVFRAGVDPAEEDGTSVAVMRVKPDEGNAQR
jgi:hypothetical protein